jgi:hypothetical protein
VALPSAWAGGSLLPPSFGGKDVHQPHEGGQLRLRGAGRAAGTVSCRVSGSLAWMASVPSPTLPPATKRGVAVRPPRGRWSHRAQVRRICSVPCVAGHAASTPPGGLYKTSYAVEVAAMFLDGLVVTPVGGQGRGPLRHGARVVVAAVVGKPLAHWWSLPLVRLPSAEVVATASQTPSATCRRASNSLALMVSLSPPIGERGQGPLHNGARIEVAITAGKPSCRIPQGQWPRTSSVTLLASGSLYLQSRDGTRTPLEGGCSTSSFCKVLLITIYQAVLALICVPPVPAVCDVVDSSLVPGPPPGMQA